MAGARQAQTRRDTGELNRDAKRARRVSVAELETIDEGMVRKVNEWLRRKEGGLGEWREAESPPRWKRKEQPPIETHSLLAAQLRAIVTGARRDGKIYFKFDVGED